MMMLGEEACVNGDSASTFNSEGAAIPREVEVLLLARIVNSSIHLLSSSLLVIQSCIVVI